ncbi:MAG: AI-2E family transporter, partial [Patescibacteria group bacterium]
MSSSLHISTGTLIRALLVVAAAIFLYRVSDILTALFFAIIVASALEPSIEWLAKRGVPRLVGVMSLYAAGVLLLAFFGYLVLPLLFEDIGNISTTYPQIREGLLSFAERIGLPSITPFIAENIPDLLRSSSDYAGEVGGGIFS